MNRKNIPFLLVALILLSLACGFGTSQLDAMSQTLTPLSAIVKGSATARAAGDTGASDELATAIVKATVRSQEIYTTQTVRASLSDASKLATATAIAPVVAELPLYGVDPGQGYVAWMHEPATIELSGYQQNGFVNDYSQITAKDFVMASDITWNTKNSLSGCGFMFRSNGDKNKPSQYMVVISRFASGHLAFTATVDGDISNVRTFFPKDEDKSFNWFNDSTNRLTVVARGPLLDIYTNGVLVGQVDTTQPPPSSIGIPPQIVLPAGANSQQVQDYQDQLAQYNDTNQELALQLAAAKRNFSKNKAILTDGLLGFLGISQSGQMKCTFDNAWLFIIEP
jgi:outer membrane lipopolysaccharide assembly protein LptE/RlpB